MVKYNSQCNSQVVKKERRKEKVLSARKERRQENIGCDGGKDGRKSIIRNKGKTAKKKGYWTLKKKEGKKNTVQS